MALNTSGKVHGGEQLAVNTDIKHEGEGWNERETEKGEKTDRGKTEKCK